MARLTAASVVSPSVQIILEQLDDLRISKTEFARALGVSPDYVYRILKGRVPVPYVRETLERVSEILDLDPHAFSEYREMEQALSASTRLVWQRLKELKMTREDLFQALGGRISRPYFNSILRGDQPFPGNRAFIQLFALCLDLPPTAFREFGRPQAPRWEADDVVELEERVFSLLFDKLMADRGFTKNPIALIVLDEPKVMSIFLSAAEMPSELNVILARMGELGMGLPELIRISAVPAQTLRSLFTGKIKAAKHHKDLEEIKRVLHIIK
jgi:transcriptional regulator with XRE-family HTH domain